MTKQELIKLLERAGDDSHISIIDNEGWHRSITGVILSPAIPDLRIDEAYLQLGQRVGQ